jgi:DNA-binding CsgD family transcriptional regulator
LIETTRGQVWKLQVIDGQLFCGNNNGTFLIKGPDAQLITDIAGGWTYLKLPGHENKLIAGTYSGMVLLGKTGNSWTATKKIKGFNESCRLLEVDTDGSIWMSHGFKGVFHIFLNEELDSVYRVDFYNSSNGFDTDFGINVVKLNDKIFFTAPAGVYEYNQIADSFEKSLFFKDLIQAEGLSKLVEDEKGNIWYFANKELNVLRKQEDGAFVNISLPFKQIKGNFIGGFEFVYPIDEHNVLFGASNGFIHYNPNQFKDYQLPFSACINKVSLLNPDSIIFSGHKPITEIYKPVIKFRNNGLYFSFSASDFENPEKTEFSTFLDGYDTEWTGWEVRYSREFTNLHEGDYTFYVKARNIYEVETEPVHYKFTIHPPWVRTWVAYVIYTIFGLLIIWIVLMIIKRKINQLHQKEKKRQQEKFKEREEKLQRETLEAEKEIIRLRNEKLSEQMILKDKELANSTMDMIQKNKLLTRIKNDLKKMTSKAVDTELKSQIHILSREINKELDTEKQWEVFETHFENVHEAFLNRLKTQYPELSPRELKLCAYLRMNISSKEIAVLMNISTRGVEISRYRLRRKLKLTRDENLTDFILTY